MEAEDAHPSRRSLLKTGLAAAGAAAIGVTADADAKASALRAGAEQSQSPAVVTARRFRGWISRGSGRGRTTVQDLTLRPISGRQVVVRTEATNLCYSNTGAVLGLGPNFGGRLATMALIQGHGGVGVVEAVGPEVRRVQVGDRVCVSGTPQCGSCYQCLRGRADMCQFLGRQGPDDLVPIADMRDGTPVYANSHIGGLAELMVTFEEWVVPIFTKATAADLGMVCSCVAVAGLGATDLAGACARRTRLDRRRRRLRTARPERRAGCADLGRIDDHRDRSDSRAARARHEGRRDAHARSERRGRHARRREFASCRRVRTTDSGQEDVIRVDLLGGAGADFVIEAVGADSGAAESSKPVPIPPASFRCDRPTRCARRAAHIVTTSLPRGNITLPAVLFTIGGRTHHAGQAGGASPMRDIPRFVELLDEGQYNAKALATTVVPIERMLEAYEDVVYRTTVTAIMTA